MTKNRIRQVSLPLLISTYSEAMYRPGASVVARLNRRVVVPRALLRPPTSVPLGRRCPAHISLWAAKRTFASVSEPPLPTAPASSAPSSSSGVTPIEQLVLDTIKLAGPISFAKYMGLCLSHPTHGYYMNPSNAVFGTSGDFITSPEISQVFGELMAIWFITQWAAAGSPTHVRIVELGPGRGTLMDDMLRVLRKFLPPDTLASVHLVETSKALRGVQSSKLGCEPAGGGEESYSTLPGGKVRVEWHDSLTEIERREDVYTMLVAHEFFDALPVHVVQKTETGWNEVMIASTESSSPKTEGSSTAPPTQSPPAQDTASSSTQASNARLRRVLNPLPSPISTLLGNSSPRFRSLPEGTSIEVSPTSFRIAHQIGRLLSSWDADGLLKEGQTTRQDASAEPSAPQEPQTAQGHGGAALIIDYGSSSFHSDSLRAFKAHKMVDLFHEPGQCDITADVDFEYLKEGMGGLVKTHGPLTQATFLNRMALAGRVAALVRNAPAEERKNTIREAAERLVDEQGMGGQYKVLGVVGGKAAGGGSGLGGSGGRGGEVAVWPFVEEVPVGEGVKETVKQDVKEDSVSKGKTESAKELETVRI
ncbi:S-adenosyl-L-methionine-dependent methyltransferase [Coprinopsis sp. MPI-PUGE-AT-0042]|nr:S-adenosyl-L-methionine-dependent methyltransferase [Coprinopsis sp. MPI-PUGE-AT-0042]